MAKFYCRRMVTDEEMARVNLRKRAGLSCAPVDIAYAEAMLELGRSLRDDNNAENVNHTNKIKKKSMQRSRCID